MKRFLLFAYTTYYPDGGMNDFLKDFDKLDDAKAWAENLDTYDRHRHILDTSDGKIIWWDDEWLLNDDE